MIIWTAAYRPFILGGNVHGPVGIKIEPLEIIEIHIEDLAIRLGLFRLSDGRTPIVEIISRAIVGHDWRTVLDDIEKSDPAFMLAQITDAASSRGRVCVITEKSFIDTWEAPWPEAD